MKNLFLAFVLLLAVISESHAQFWAKSNGRFGIGDEYAIAKLQVNANSSFSNPGIALLDSSATNTSGGILQFRSINWDDNHFNIQAKIGEYAYGQDSKLDFFFRENLIMSIEGGSTPDRQLIYNPRDGIFRTGYLNPGARGEYSVAMGYNNSAPGNYSVALGIGNQALNEGCIALGGNSIAESTYSTAIGYYNYASGPFSLAAGIHSTAGGFSAVAIGDSAVATGSSSYAIGHKTLASALSSTATGHQTDATGLYSFSGGYNTQATNTSSIAFGFYSQATGVSATSLGYATLAAGENSIALNSVTKAFGNNTLSSGYATKAYGWESSAFGNNTTTRSYVSTVFGAYNDTIATSVPDGWVSSDPLLMVGNGLSHAERNNAFTIYKNGNLLAKNPTAVTIDPGALPLPVNGAGTRMMWVPEKSSFRAGTVYFDEWDADQMGVYSFASGFNTVASASRSTAMGDGAKASGVGSTALGSVTVASGLWSTSMGYNTRASGSSATSIGRFTKAKSYAETAIGQYNDTIAYTNPYSWTETDQLFVVGNGTSDSMRHSAFTIYKNGNILAKNPTTISTNPGVVTLPASGSGTRMMWIPEKSAFRAGTVSDDSWDETNIGTWSLASGYNAKATQSNDIALGYFAEATGGSSLAAGYNPQAIGAFSVALGNSNIALGNWSLALGSSSVAGGTFSTSMGWHSQASGEIATSMGTASIARAYRSTAIGSYNDSIATSSPSSWVNTDPLFMIGNGTSEATRHNAFTIFKNGDLLARNPSTLIFGFGDDALPDSGGGTRMMWLPGRGAFRVGTVWDDQWDESNIGGWSFASGLNTKATNEASTAMGVNATASGLHSVAIGFGVEASAEKTFAFGTGSQASSTYSIAIGYESNATNFYAMALGAFTEASGNTSLATGNSTIASGDGSTAMGNNTTASGHESFAVGASCEAFGAASTAIGVHSTSKAYWSTSLGSCNDEIITSNPSAWVETDPILTIGNSPNPNSPSNAMVVYKNGNTDINGYTRLGEESESAPRIKMKELPLATAGVNYNSSVSIPHGLMVSKILSVSVFIEWDDNLLAPPEYSPSLNLRYNYILNATDIVVQNNTPSGDCLICERPVHITITYKE